MKLGIVIYGAISCKSIYLYKTVQMLINTGVEGNLIFI
jgi:hypothetical protein